MCLLGHLPLHIIHMRLSLFFLYAQIAASPQVEYVKKEDIDTEWVARERAVEMGKEDLQGKPEAIREKIVDGRINKRLSEVSLVDQAYIKDTNKTVAEVGWGVV